ncbi:hypothetical protein DFH28DRAFT_927884 [Melampsora americana]|nr:hypothetical protein DFH28DRAFT_927884 [Melampsora americana]
MSLSILFMLLIQSNGLAHVFEHGRSSSVQSSVRATSHSRVRVLQSHQGDCTPTAGGKTTTWTSARRGFVAIEAQHRGSVLSAGQGKIVQWPLHTGHCAALSAHGPAGKILRVADGFLIAETWGIYVGGEIIGIKRKLAHHNVM